MTPSRVEIRERPIAEVESLAAIPIAYRVERVLELALVEGGLGGLTLSERELETPWTKDYDACAGEGPRSWAKHFDLSNWGLLVAVRGEELVGGAALAFDTPGVDMLEGRRDLAVLWDIRVRPEVRAAGIGTRLFQAAEAWARARGCRALKVETQNINVAACRFYRQMGCELASLSRTAYAKHPDEIQMIWRKALGELLSSGSASGT